MFTIYTSYWQTSPEPSGSFDVVEIIMASNYVNLDRAQMVIFILQHGF